MLHAYILLEIFVFSNVLFLPLDTYKCIKLNMIIINILHLLSWMHERNV